MFQAFVEVMTLNGVSVSRGGALIGDANGPCISLSLGLAEEGLAGGKGVNIMPGLAQFTVTLANPVSDESHAIAFYPNGKGRTLAEHRQQPVEYFENTLDGFLAAIAKMQQALQPC